ncbi:penicillin-binding transpeptidase domain-containing protein [Clostridiaceae bacterium 35-E11]
MFEKLQDRHNQVILFFAIFISVLLFRLFGLTIVEGDKYKKIADEIRIKKIPISAPRGEIRDRYGRPLAVNKPSFTVQMMKNELIDEKINEVSVKLLDILIKNHEKYDDNFPIKIQKDNQFYYTYDQEISQWIYDHQHLLNGREMQSLKNAEDVFELLRENLQIDPSLDVFEAQMEMQTKHDIYPPISVKTMKFIPQMQKENFLEGYNLNKELNAEEAFQALKEKFQISGNYSKEDIRNILLIRNQLREQGYRQYQPVKIALNVSSKTVTEIEERSMELPGINIEVEPIRYYPNDRLVSHVIGYLGKMSESDKDRLIQELDYSPNDLSNNEKNQILVNELGYLSNDLIGKDGLERTFEKDLKGKDGARYVEVDVYGRLINVLREEKPEKGKTIYLSIDAKLQKIAEDALEQALKEIQVGGTFKSKFGDYKYRETFRNATSGAVVALDVKTGEVLALASYPSFNPNLFATGISAEDWKSVQDDNPRDPLSPVPLYNVATRTAVQPGSIFKMITGLAAIEQGLDPAKQLYDDGYIKLGNRNFGCWLWNDYKRKHGWVDLYKALEVSCNYYFYNVSTGWDHFKNQSLGISMNVDKVLEYAKIFGLDEPTGVEIYESAYGVPNPSKKMVTMQSLLKRDIRAKAKDYFEEEVLSDKHKLEEIVEKITSWMEENPSRGTLIDRISKMPVKKEKVEALADLVKFSYFNQAKWTKGDTFNLSIGQGQHAYTPIQMANYIATLANGGYKHSVSVIKKVGSEKDSENNEEKKGQKLPLKNPKNLDHVKKGMERVTQGDEGTGRTVFRNFPINVVAKTGTAQRSGKIQPKNEAAYLRKYLRWIAPNISIAAIEEKTKEIIKEDKDKYKDEGMAMRKAIKELSKGKITDATLDQYKDNYDNFAWFVSYAPYDDPQIAVVSLIFQGGHGGYAAPIAREIIAEYLGLNKEYDKIYLKNTLTN